MDTFTAIIDLWPSTRDFAADIGVSPTHVAVWRHRNSIPDYHWADLIEAARRREINVSLEMLAAIAKAKRPRRSPHPEGRAAPIEGRAA